MSTLVTQTSGSVYWPQVQVINIHDAGACALPIPECLSFPDLNVNTFKVDAFPAFLFDLDSPPNPTDALQPERFLFDTVGSV